MPAAGSTDGRPWDVVVLGGSGFYGQRVAAELLCLSAEAGQPLRIALVARSPGKLEAACKQVLSLAVSAAGEAPEAAGRMPQLGVAACDASDLASVRRLAASTRVLLACLPTYRAVGEGLVQACAEAGTHYFDLSVETDMHTAWAARYGEEAAESGALICHACGQDHVLADFGALLAARLFSAPGERLESVAGVLQALPGARLVLRESTLHATLDRWDQDGGASAAGAQRGRPSGGEAAPKCRVSRGALPRWSTAAGAWLLPGIPSEADIVAATAAHMARCELRGQPVAPSYTCHLAAQSLPAAVALGGIGALLALSHFAAPRRLLRALLPPLLRGAGLLTADEAVYAESMAQLRVRKLLVARGTSAGGAAEERTLELEASSMSLTPLALALAAWVALQESSGGRRLHAAGFATPAAAFHATSYWELLVERAGISVRTPAAK